MGVTAVPAAGGVAAGPAVGSVLGVDLLHLVAVGLVAQEFLEGDEAGDGEGHEGGEDGLLGDEGDDDVGETQETDDLHLGGEQDGDEGTDDLLLLATTCGTRGKETCV